MVSRLGELNSSVFFPTLGQMWWGMLGINPSTLEVEAGGAEFKVVLSYVSLRPDWAAFDPVSRIRPKQNKSIEIFLLSRRGRRGRDRIVYVGSIDTKQVGARSPKTIQQCDVEGNEPSVPRRLQLGLQFLFVLGTPLRCLCSAPEESYPLPSWASSSSQTTSAMCPLLTQPDSRSARPCSRRLVRAAASSVGMG